MSDRYVAREENHGSSVSFHGASFVVIDTTKQEPRDHLDSDEAIICYCADLERAEAVAGDMNFREYDYQGVFDDD